MRQLLLYGWFSICLVSGSSMYTVQASHDRWLWQREKKIEREREKQVMQETRRKSSESLTGFSDRNRSEDADGKDGCKDARDVG